MNLTAPQRQDPVCMVQPSLVAHHSRGMIPSPQLRATLAGGAIAGTLDILFAITFAVVNGRTATWLLQTVATGLLGPAAYDGGTPAALLGLAAHFALSIGWAALFFTFAAHRPRLIARPFFTTMLFGVLVFLVMRLAVLPLSAFPYPVSVFSKAAGLDLLSHVFLFAPPIVFAAARMQARGHSPAAGDGECS
jgi:hypothetical protein